jgi:hypothetical protein
MSGKTGGRLTGRKPQESERTGAKTDGAFGKEDLDQVEAGAVSLNLHHSVKQKVRSEESTSEAPELNQYRCATCGRHFNSSDELAEHAEGCEAAFQSGRVNKAKVEEPREDGVDRDWVSVP